MATETTPAVAADVRRVGAALGIALDTTLQTVAFPNGTRHLAMRTRTYTTGVVAQLNLCPYLAVLKTSDALADEANLDDYTAAAQDGNAATDIVLSSLDTAANNNYLYVGSQVPFRGVDIDVDATNSTASVLTVNYWNGTVWGDISDTDGTISTGATMGQDGQVTWAVPSDWATGTLAGIGDTTLSGIGVLTNLDYYWTRWQVSVQLDSSVTLNSMLGLNRGAAFELAENEELEFSINKGPGGVAGIEGVMNAGTGFLLPKAITRKQFETST